MVEYEFPTSSQAVKYDRDLEKVDLENKGAPCEMMMVREIIVQPNDYMSYAIIVTICCCLPLGLVALIRSLQVRMRFDKGDFEGARLSAQSSKHWSIAGLAVGICIQLLCIFSILAAIFLYES